MQDINTSFHLTKNKAQAIYLNDKVRTTMKNSLGDLIRKRMKDLNIRSKVELARLVGVSAPYMGDLINATAKTKSGTYSPSFEVIGKLAEVLQIKPNDVIDAIFGINNRVLPHELAIMDYDGFDDEDLEDIAEYVNFKRLQKEKKL